jgi:hypothetical protein
LGQESEIELGEVVADIFHGASPEAEPLGLHRQILTQLRVAISEVVSDYRPVHSIPIGYGRFGKLRALSAVRRIDQSFGC